MDSDGVHALVLLLELAIGGVAFVFWLRTLCECAAEEPAGKTKITWVIVIFFGHIFGALLYYALRRPRLYAEEGR
jgi:hypothetical protein